MSSKNISVRDDIYRALKNEKREDESFSEVIDRLLARREGEHPLYDLVGILDDEQADRLREKSAEFRDNVDERMEPQS